MHGLDPAFDHAPGDGFVPCGEGVGDYAITQEQVDHLGDELADQVVRVDEEHFGQIGDASAAVTPSGFVSTDGVQDNNWTVQVISACDLTPGGTTAGEIVSGDTYVYRFAGDDLTTPALDTGCANGSGRDCTVSVSNLPTGDLAVLDATYDYSVVHAKR